MTAPIEKLHARVRAIKARVAIRNWELRQRDHAAGAWHRLERLFANSRRAWTISERDVEALVARGREPERIGFEFEPNRIIFVVSIEDVELLEGAKEIALRATPELLLARALALVPFKASPPSPPPSPPPRS